MVNFTLNTTSLLGIIDILGAIVYFILVKRQLKIADKTFKYPIGTPLKESELLICPIALFFSGLILLFNGWRLDPILQIQQLLFHSIVIFAIIKEFKLVSGSRR